jgi:hypothetical protein
MSTGSKNTILGRFTGNQGGLDIRTSSNNIVLSDGDGNPRGIFTSDGSFLVGTTSVTTTGVGGVTLKAGYSLGRTIVQIGSTGTSAGTELVHFYNNNGRQGYIQTNSSGTNYVTTSDYRLKENVVELTGATERLKQLNPSRFNFIADGTDTVVDGFLAHEVQTVVPEAISGTHNEVDDDGNPVYQGIDQSKLVPLLVATIKELEARITALEAN